MRRLGLALLLGIVVALAVVGWIKLEGERPRATLTQPLSVLGQGTTIEALVEDERTGVRTARLVLEADGTVYDLASEERPATSWRGSDAHQVTLSAPLDPRRRKIPEGPAVIRVFADDHSWRRWLRSEKPALEQQVTIDLTPPALEVLSQQHYLRLGGLDFVLYKTSPDASKSGVRVADYFFPGTAGLFEDPEIHAAFFAVPQDLDAKAIAKAVSEDAAGNRREVPFHTVTKPRRFSDSTMGIDDEFLTQKVPELLEANDGPPAADLVAGYLWINRTLRQQSEERIRAVTRTSAPTQLWDGPFLRQPNAAPLAGFADRRTYVYKGQTIDHQTHLGFDLASLRQSEVPAGNAGKVVLAGPLGIYGEAVIIDHGLGIFSLYAHLSSVRVKVGDDVARGDVIGRTGATGLAGGDHLHYSVMLYGVHVDPIEWWDGKWIRDHVTAKLDAYPRATVTAKRDGDGAEPARP